MGIGPTQPAWKAGTLPLSYTRKGRCPVNISNITTKGCKCQQKIKKIKNFFLKYFFIYKFNQNNPIFGCFGAKNSLFLAKKLYKILIKILNKTLFL